MNRDSLPTSALRLAGLDALSLAGRSEREICELVNRYPILAELYRLLTANARVAGAHLRLSKVFLFAPQRVRDRSGFGDPGVVSNRTGTTGMDETWLEMLTRVRHHHLLGPLHVAVGQTPDSPGATGRVDGESSRLEDPRVHFVNTGIAPEEFGIPRSADEIVERR
jgi:hypothetical protein